MFEFDSGDQGSSGPYLKWHVQGNKQISENSFSIKESGEGQPRVDVTDKMKKSVVIDIDNFRTGWSLFPDWQWNASVKKYEKSPGKDWTRGFSVPVAFADGQTATWLQANSVGAWESFAGLARGVDPNARPDGKFPVVKFTSVNEKKLKKGSTSVAGFTFVKWIDRPESLDAAADEPAIDVEDDDEDTF